MKKRILITGSNGLLGQKIVRNYSSDDRFEIVATARGECRIEGVEGFTYVTLDTSVIDDVHAVFRQVQPDVVIHAAAMTNVDACELNPEECDLLNIEATRNVVRACEEIGCYLVHVSTDFIFDGADGPYNEEATPNPLSHYGWSKLHAEELVQQATCSWSIARTVLVIGVVPGLSRSNIVLWAKGALSKGEKIRVVDDQWRTPTLAEDLADGCMLLAASGKTGVYNISGEDFYSVFEMVQVIADHWKLDKSLIEKVSSETLAQPAKRPPKTGFIIEKAKIELGYKPHAFLEAIELISQQAGGN